MIRVLKKFLILFFLFCSGLATAQTIRSTSFDDRTICEKSKGTWRQFGNDCADKCRNKFEKYPICVRASVFGCECSKNHCWNGEECVFIRDYKQIFDAEYAKEQEILEAAKESRKVEALANKEEIIAKLNKPTDLKPKNLAEKGKASFEASNNFLKSNISSSPSFLMPSQDDFIPTNPVTQIMPPMPLSDKNQADVEIPDFFLKKQAQVVEEDPLDSMPMVLPSAPSPN